MADRGDKGRDFEDFWGDHVCQCSEPSIIVSTKNPRERWEIGISVQTKAFARKRGDAVGTDFVRGLGVRLETDRYEHHSRSRRCIL